ncbi:MAG: ABC transporter permease subunit [Isosphaeraceae bacterium]|nr:ABC transporter permease subunit [Isosphaeraceae bacterium]
MLAELTTLLLGPLVGPECRRAVARGWLIVLRALAASVLMGVVLIAVWWWWLNVTYVDDTYQPLWALRTAIGIAEGMVVTVALVMGPALLAGSLAGERERGALGLLLTTRVTSREIVLGRLIGKLTQVGMILLACLPALLFLGMLAGFRLDTQAVLALLPLAVAFGGSGLAVGASIYSRRGRDALLAVYVGEVLFLLSPLTSLTGLPTELSEWVGALNPYLCFGELVWGGDPHQALVSCGLWLALGMLGAVLAAWRLRPSCLALGAGEKPRRVRRRGWVPVMDERPMLWKELYIERAGALGRIGRWLTLLFVGLVVVPSVVFAGVYAWALFVRPSSSEVTWAIFSMKMWVANPAMFVGWLIEWAVGLRAAVVIASERERGTWDALLTSPLDGREIVRGKLYGSLYALRLLLGAAIVAWTLAFVCEAMTTYEFITQVVGTAIVAAFMAAVGVRASLAVSTATRAMSWTIGVWLGARVAISIVAGLILAVIAVVIYTTWMALMQFGAGTGPMAPPIPGWLTRIAWPLTTNTLYVLSAALIVSDTRLRFDRIAGRMTEGRMSVVLDRMIYGEPIAPVFIGDEVLVTTEEPQSQNAEEPVSEPV